MLTFPTHFTMRPMDLPLLPTQVENGTATAVENPLDRIGRDAQPANFAGSDTYRLNPEARAGDRIKELVDEYMSRLECAIPQRPGQTRPQTLEGAMQALNREVPQDRRERIVRYTKLFCSGLAGAVAEVIRSYPQLEPYARNAGSDMAQSTASGLARGLFIPPPGFYQIAAEAQARFDAAALPTAAFTAQPPDLEHQWTRQLDDFFLQRITAARSQGRSFEMDRLAQGGVVTVFGPDALRDALMFLPAGETVVRPAFISRQWRQENAVYEMRYSEQVQRYNVIQRGVEVELQLRNTPGGSEYRLGRTGAWAPNPHAVPAARRAQQIEALRQAHSQVFVSQMIDFG